MCEMRMYVYLGGSCWMLNLYESISFLSLSLTYILYIPKIWNECWAQRRFIRIIYGYNTSQTARTISLCTWIAPQFYNRWYECQLHWNLWLIFPQIHENLHAHLWICWQPNSFVRRMCGWILSSGFITRIYTVCNLEWHLKHERTRSSRKSRF